MNTHVIAWYPVLVMYFVGTWIAGGVQLLVCAFALLAFALAAALVYYLVASAFVSFIDAIPDLEDQMVNAD